MADIARSRIAGPLLLLVLIVFVRTPAFAQTDFSGEWSLRGNEVLESVGQPPLGDYLGIPFNEAGRMRAARGRLCRPPVNSEACRSDVLLRGMGITAVDLGRHGTEGSTRLPHG